jgi:hypothetical protein
MKIQKIGAGLALVFAASAFAQASDNCSDAPVGTGTVAFDLSAATNDGTATCGLSAGSADQWFRYVAPATGNARFSTCGGAGFDTVLSAFDGCGGTQLVCNDDSCGLQSSIAVAVTTGQTVWVRIAGYNGAIGSGSVTITDPSGGPVANDNCGSATVVTAGTYPFSTEDASNDGTGSCGGSDTSPDVWYRYVAPGAGVATFETCGSSFDTVLSAFDSCGGTELLCNDDACGLQSRVRVNMTAGQVVLIRVAGFVGRTGVGTLTVADPVPGPANDNCANAIAVTSGSSTQYDTNGSSRDGLASCDVDGTGDIWYRYTPTASGEVNVSVSNTTADVDISLFDGCGGTELACSFTGSTNVIVAAGTAYLIRLSNSFGDDPSSGSLDVGTPTAVVVWDEVVNGGGDAGDLPDGAQVVAGSGSVSRITGVVDAGNADMFRINICDSSVFQASTVEGADFDTQLWLFNTDGTGVAFNDDTTGGQSVIDNSLVTSNGEYLLAISGYNYDAVDASGQLIWNNTPFGGVRGPDGPGAASPISAWAGASGDGDYTIRLNGACFSTGGGPRCVADFDDGTGTGMPDGAVTIDDLLYYLGVYENGAASADVDNGTGTGTRDGGVTIDDLLYYLIRYEQGC